MDAPGAMMAASTLLTWVLGVSSGRAPRLPRLIDGRAEEEAEPEDEEEGETTGFAASRARFARSVASVVSPIGRGGRDLDARPALVDGRSVKDPAEVGEEAGTPEVATEE